MEELVISKEDTENFIQDIREKIAKRDKKEMILLM